jgi:hypothetical protein
MIRKLKSGNIACNHERKIQKPENAGIGERLRQRPQPRKTSEQFSSFSGIRRRVLVEFDGARLPGASFSSRSILPT